MEHLSKLPSIFFRCSIVAFLLTFFWSLVTALSLGKLTIFLASFLAVQAVGLGLLYGGLYAIVHLNRRPTLLSSLTTSFGAMGIALVVSILAGSFAGPSMLVAYALIAAGCVYGICTYLAGRSAM